MMSVSLELEGLMIKMATGSGCYTYIYNCEGVDSWKQKPARKQGATLSPALENENQKAKRSREGAFFFSLTPPARNTPLSKSGSCKLSRVCRRCSHCRGSGPLGPLTDGVSPNTLVEEEVLHQLPCTGPIDWEAQCRDSRAFVEAQGLDRMTMSTTEGPYVPWEACPCSSWPS